ncbi:uroporphyrinogen decarboxylase/cobalamine-independent methonine synthase family protein [Tichowtungia aerotolerans]|uniref:Trimethylamine corrinoid protein 2 n=1 Tax=Tichowtungia aerotolerans TaxID=2697043 RepID=A0A6P1M813_9BACT|nr:hypothetical protein [Tichowtungia aerotolerans]QHI70017.1 hypothetical protein GT409_11350 [Tichowtungia aerotolerans]
MNDTDNKELLYKNDWAEAQQILTGWWNGKVDGRWALGVVAKRNEPLPHDEPPPLSDDFQTRWLDFRTINAHKEAFFSEHCYLGCAFPENTAYLGPGSMNPFLGSSIDFQETTLWYNPIADTPENVDQLNLDKTGFYWNWTKAALAYIAEQAKRRYIATMPDLIEGLDILSELFGTQEFLMHLIDCPEAIHRLLDQLDVLYFEAYDELADIIKSPAGYVPYMAFNAWGPGRCAKVQCDFSAMISPDMYEEFVKPHIQKQCRRLDYTVYHLDGPDALRHIDSVLSIPELDALQWEPGAGNPHTAHRDWWDTVWKKVYAAGKSAFLHGVPADDVEPFVKEFGQNGTLIITHTDTEDQAKRLMDKSLRWS